MVGIDRERKLAILRDGNAVPYDFLVLATGLQESSVWGDEKTNFGVKSCWVRNLKKAPERLEEKLMDKGIPPMLPEQFCKFKDGQEKLNGNDLEIIWTEEGDSASLLLKNEIIQKR